ncbi:hypothetical protein NEHOM01_2318 [Nematocida homosporus]|uniref:uncharacterized protein n=1 Tax=Nematocida homosporus TaxID=1912981 RepID=UPI00221F3059|nr:uncharacterized protein NEHOM01_2318 [Nematocida homosporus]KAI5187718.1 hypothetical protein NEHOM01_2318 [Nematocida homosporus]
MFISSKAGLVQFVLIVIGVMVVFSGEGCLCSNPAQGKKKKGRGVGSLVDKVLDKAVAKVVERVEERVEKKAVAKVTKKVTKEIVRKGGGGLMERVMGRFRKS